MRLHDRDSEQRQPGGSSAYIRATRTWACEILSTECRKLSPALPSTENRHSAGYCMHSHAEFTAHLRLPVGGNAALPGRDAPDAPRAAARFDARFTGFIKGVDGPCGFCFIRSALLLRSAYVAISDASGMPGLPSSGKSELSPSPPAILVIRSRFEFFMLMRILLRSASFTVPKPDEENPSDELARSHEENERSIVFSESSTPASVDSVNVNTTDATAGVFWDPPSLGRPSEREIGWERG